MILQPIFLVVALAAAPPEFTVQPLEGKPVVGSIVEVDNRHVTIEGPDGRVSLPIEKLLTISPKEKLADPKGPPRVWVDLTDGSRILAEQYTVANGRARVKLLDGQSLEVPARSVATVRLQPDSGTLGNEWARILDTKPKSDVLVTAKGETADYHKGAVHDVTDTLVQFDLDGETLGVKREKVFGLIYYHATEDQEAEPICQITDAAGCRWSVRTISLAGKLQWTTPAGIEVSRPLDQVAGIDLSGGKIVYLSDLTPQSSTYTPYFALPKELPARLAFFRPRKDRNLESKPLRFDGQQFAKGLAMHTRTELVYQLPGRFSRFAAVAGIDQEVRPRGSVRLILSNGDKVLLETTIKGTDPAKPIEVDLTGVRRLTILADFTGDLDVAGHLDLGDARVIK
jgi:hypothetical protein